MVGIDVRRTSEDCKNNQRDFLPWMDFEFNFEQIISIAGFKGLIKEAQANDEITKEIEYFTDQDVNFAGAIKMSFLDDAKSLPKKTS
jgi:hypothetical protein